MDQQDNDIPQGREFEEDKQDLVEQTEAALEVDDQNIIMQVKRKENQSNSKICVYVVLVLLLLLYIANCFDIQIPQLDASQRPIAKKLKFLHNIYNITYNDLQNIMTFSSKNRTEHKYTFIFLASSEPLIINYFGRQDYIHADKRSKVPVPPNCKLIFPISPQISKSNIEIQKVQPTQGGIQISQFQWIKERVNDFDEKVAKSESLSEIQSMVNQGHLRYQSMRVLKIALNEAEILGDPSRVFIGGAGFGGSVALGAYLLYNGSIPFGGIVGIKAIQLLDTDYQLPKEDLRKEILDMRMNTPMLQWFDTSARLPAYSQSNAVFESIAYFKNIYHGNKNLMTKFRTSPKFHRQEVKKVMRTWFKNLMPN